MQCSRTPERIIHINEFKSKKGNSIILIFSVFLVRSSDIPAGNHVFVYFKITMGVGIFKKIHVDINKISISPDFVAGNVFISD